MACWQVHTDMLTGGEMTFGLQAEDREAAQVAVLLLLDGKGASGVQITGIPPPPERLRTGSGTFRSGSG